MHINIAILFLSYILIISISCATRLLAYLVLDHPVTVSLVYWEHHPKSDGNLYTNYYMFSFWRILVRWKPNFPIFCWSEVLDAESDVLEDAIRCGGLARTKAGRIKSILKTLKEKKGDFCLEYLRGLSIDVVKTELSQFKGIGPKTVCIQFNKNVNMINILVPNQCCTLLCKTVSCLLSSIKR